MISAFEEIGVKVENDGEACFEGMSVESLTVKLKEKDIRLLVNDEMFCTEFNELYVVYNDREE